MNISVINFLTNFFLLITALMGASVFVRQNTVFSVLSLIVTFFSGAVLMLINNAEFLSFVVLTIYIGAVAVLFLFIVMMVDLDKLIIIKSRFDERIVALFLALIIFFTLCNAMKSELITKQDLINKVIDSSIQSSLEDSVYINNDQVKNIGILLYDTGYAIVVILVGLILFSAIIGVIILSLRSKTGIKKQNVFDKLARNASNTLTVKKVGFGDGVNDE